MIQEYSPLDVRIHVHVVPQAISAAMLARELETDSFHMDVLTWPFYDAPDRHEVAGFDS